MLNQIVIMGRLTRDPELRYTQSGTAVTSFTLAVDRDMRNKETGERQTDFIDCVAWRNTAEFAANYFSKGRMAVVEGRLQIRDWTDKDGNKRKSAEVLVGSLYFGDSKNSAGKEDPLDELQRDVESMFGNGAPESAQSAFGERTSKGVKGVFSDRGKQTEMDFARTRGGGFSELDEDEKLPF